MEYININIIIVMQALYINVSSSSLFFSDCFVYLCDFHREQAWERWVSARKNDVLPVKEEVLSMMRRVARANTPEKYYEALISFKENPQYVKNKHLARWFSTQWEPHYKVCRNIFTMIKYLYICTCTYAYLLLFCTPHTLICETSTCILKCLDIFC